MLLIREFSRANARFAFVCYPLVYLLSFWCYPWLIWLVLSAFSECFPRRNDRRLAMIVLLPLVYFYHFAVFVLFWGVAVCWVFFRFDRQRNRALDPTGRKIMKILPGLWLVGLCLLRPYPFSLITPPAAPISNDGIYVGDFSRTRTDILIDKYNVWFLGRSGAGKTTTIGLLLDGALSGKGGFAHDTEIISSYPLVVMGANTSGSQHLIALDLMDTRGHSDIEYSLSDLLDDLAVYPQYTRSKIVMVVKQDRLDPGTLKILHYASVISKGHFIIVVTACDQDIVKLQEILKKQDVAHGPIICYHSFLHKKEETKNDLLKAILMSPFVNVAEFRGRGAATTLFEYFDKWGYRLVHKAVGADLLGVVMIAVNTLGAVFG